MITALLLLLLASLTHAEDWSYEGETGPDNWYKLDPEYYLCREDIDQQALKSRAKFVSNPASLLNVNYERILAEYNVSLEQENFGLEAGPFPESFSVRFDKQKFELKQFHMHTLSEHHLFGKQTPLEIHFVHKNEETDKLLVIGILFEEGDESNKFFDELFKGDFTTPKLLENVPVQQLMQDALQRGVYMYDGSLTTPPCSEGVQWFVAAKTLPISSSHLDSLKQAMKPNFRPLQAI